MPTAIVKIDGKTEYLTLMPSTDRDLQSAAKAKKTSSENILRDVYRQAEKLGQRPDEKMVRRYLLGLQIG